MWLSWLSCCMYSRTPIFLVHTNPLTFSRKSLCNICVRVSMYLFNILLSSTWLSDSPNLVFLLWERSMSVMAKVVPVQWGPESHKVSVVLLKCCSILFICKCCNLSVNVVNTNEERRGGKPPTFLRGLKARTRALSWSPKITHLTSSGALVRCPERHQL